MSLLNVPIGDKAPEQVNVIIENPLAGDPVKYELDKETGAIFVDRFLQTPMFYPGNYGYIPQTLSDDGDPVDVLVAGHIPVMPGAVMPVTPVGVLEMEDESGQDEKIIAVPTAKIYPYYASVKDYTDLPEILRQQIEHFFSRYKDLEKGKWVKIKGWAGRDVALRLIREGIDRVSAKAA